MCGILLIAIVGMFIAYARGQVDELGSAGVAILGGFDWRCLLSHTGAAVGFFGAMMHPLAKEPPKALVAASNWLTITRVLGNPTHPETSFVLWP